MRKCTHPTEYNWGRRNGRPWTDEEIIQARFMRERLRMSSDDIGAVLKRSALSIDAKIGYQPVSATATRAETRAAPAPPAKLPAGAATAGGGA